MGHRSRTRRTLAVAVALVGWLLLSGCNRAQPLLPTAAATAVPAAPAITPTALVAALPPTSTPLPQPTATVAPTATPTPLPTPTAVPVVLSVPPEWQAAAQAALAELNAANPAQQWQLGENGGVQLTTAAGGTPVHQEPLALSVPFTLEWEAVSQDRAADILANGHSEVEIMRWRDLTPTRKALRVDDRLPGDDGYPFQETWSLVGDATAVAALAPVLQIHMRDQTLHLAAVGDVMLDRSLGYALERGDLAYPFAYVADSLRAADLTVGNLESALGDTGAPAPKRYPFRAPPQAAAALAAAGFDLMTLANNHGMDYGPEALLQALQLLDEAGVATIGAGTNAAAAHAPYITTVNGLTLAFLGYVNVPVEVSGFDTRTWDATAVAPGLAWGEPEIVAADVAATVPLADLTIVVLHAANEYVEAPNARQQAIARAAIDAGASLVIGHHAHILQGIEYYKGGVILYGTGNFAFEIDGPPETAVFHLTLDAGGVRQIELEPAVIKFGGQPAFAPDWEGQPIRNRVYRLTTLLNSR